MVFKGQYLTYNEYQALGGNLDQTPFNLLEYNARKEIDKYAFGRLQDIEVSEETKLCIMELINLENSINNGVETSGNVINYTQKEIQEHRKEIIYRYLSNSYLEDKTPYLYRGV